MMQKIAVVDDDADVRASLRALLESVDYLVVECASARAFLERSDNADIDCLIADVRMPDMDGLQLLDEIGRRGIKSPVIVITGFADVPLAVRAMKAGALDFIEKPFDSEVLLESLRRAGAALPPVDEALAAARRRLETLSPRERQVLDCLVAGQSNKVAAVELGISPRTVEIHRAHVMDKMAVRHLSELVRIAVQLGVGVR